MGEPRGEARQMFQRCEKHEPRGVQRRRIKEIAAKVQVETAQTNTLTDFLYLIWMFDVAGASLVA